MLKEEGRLKVLDIVLYLVWMGDECCLRIVLISLITFNRQVQILFIYTLSK
jgi:hypothetical protein